MDTRNVETGVNSQAKVVAYQCRQNCIHVPTYNKLHWCLHHCTNLSKYKKEEKYLSQTEINKQWIMKFWDFNPEISNNNHIEPHMYFVDTLKMTKKWKRAFHFYEESEWPNYVRLWPKKGSNSCCFFKLVISSILENSANILTQYRLASVSTRLLPTETSDSQTIWTICSLATPDPFSATTQPEQEIDIHQRTSQMDGVRTRNAYPRPTANLDG
jgi:hypothetical protein